MKKEHDRDEMRTEYDFSKLKGLVRGKYFERYQAGVTMRYTNVSFEFLSAGDQPSIYRGTVIVRADQMVLNVDVDDGRPYSITGKRKGGFYEGSHVGHAEDNSVHAKWTRLDDIWVGTWLEDGFDYLFTFRLASSVEPRRPKPATRPKRK